VSRSRWCAARPALRFELDVGPASHRVSWVRGSLVLHDHDVEAERVLEALGGEPCMCLALLEACREPTPELARGPWRMAAFRPGAARAAAQHLRLQSQLARFAGSPQWARMPSVVQQAVPVAGVRRYQLDNQLPEAMREVLVAAWDVRRQRQFRKEKPAPDRPAEARLQAAVAPACEEAMRRSRRDLRPYATVTVECWKRGPGEASLLNGSLDSGGGALALSLPVSWLNRVWARGLAVVDGHFVLEVDQPAPARELEATVIRWERRLAGRSTASAVPCQLRRSDDGWTLCW
jgi:hypothetical protein